MSVFWTAIIAGTVAGVLSGWGVGGGTLLMIWMAFFTELSQTAIQGINLMFFIPSASGALFSHIKNGFIEKRAFLITASAGICAAVPTSLLASSQEQGFLRRIFGIFLILTGAITFFTSLQNEKTSPH